MWTWAADHMIKAESPDKQLEGGFNKVMLRQGEGTKAVQSLSKFNQHKTRKLLNCHKIFLLFKII